jgi:hypothetical protein
MDKFVIKDTVTIAIIGSAGRKDDYKLMSKVTFDKMISSVENIITNEWKLNLSKSKIILRSGGAAFADHVAVAIYRKYKNEDEDCPLQLELELPCKWDHDKQRYYDTGERDFKKNPGGTSNYYHERFSKACGIPSLYELQDAIDKGAKTLESKGFFDRNNKVSKSDRMIAFTIGDNEPKDGGTAYTWDHASIKKEYKKHVSILKLIENKN